MYKFFSVTFLSLLVMNVFAQFNFEEIRKLSQQSHQIPTTSDICEEADQSDFQEDSFGPGYLNTVLGNGELTIGLALDGTLTVFRYPSPSHHNHINFKTPWAQEACQLRGQPFHGAEYNQGQFFLIQHNQKWLRLDPINFYSYQYYQGQKIVTQFEKKDGSLSILLEDVLDKDKPIHRRSLKLLRGPKSLKIALVSNFTIKSHKYSYLPLQDLFEFDQKKSPIDLSGNQITYTGERRKLIIVSSPQSLKALDAKNTEKLHPKVNHPQNSALVSEVFLQKAIHFYNSFDGAVSSIDALVPPTFQLPENLPSKKIEYVLERAILNILVGQDRNTGGIIASVASQPTYFFSWPRDIAFTILALDRAGLVHQGTQAAKFLARHTRDCLEAPDLICRLNFVFKWLTDWPLLDGTLAMNYYNDGQIGGPLFFEIDNTALTHWIWWEHGQYLTTKEAHKFYSEIYPTFERGIKTLINCKDPDNNLQCYAMEDDKPEMRQTIHGANTVHMALTAFIKTSKFLNKNSSLVDQAMKRKKELTEATFQHLIPNFKEQLNPTEYGQIAWSLWPGTIFKDQEKITCDLMGKLYRNLTPHLLKQTKGARYLGKILTAIINQKPALIQNCIDQSQLTLEEAVRISLEDLSTPHTHQFGEAFITVDNRSFLNRTAIPHIWQGALNFLVASYFFE